MMYDEGNSVKSKRQINTVYTIVAAICNSFKFNICFNPTVVKNGNES